MVRNIEVTKEKNVDMEYEAVMGAIKSLPKSQPKEVTYQTKVGDYDVSLISSDSSGQQISIKDIVGNEVFFNKENINEKMLKILIRGGDGFDLDNSSDTTIAVIDKINEDIEKQKSKGLAKITPDTRGVIEWGNNKLWLATMTDIKKEELRTMLKIYRSESNIRVFLPENGRNNFIIEELVDNIDMYQ